MKHSENVFGLSKKEKQENFSSKYTCQKSKKSQTSLNFLISCLKKIKVIDKSDNLILTSFYLNCDKRCERRL